ncbi:hypothetical protein [Moraxella marmotae]|uniref:hypothetical protein n=1 Tax=Moraxella marmotae TaxID=3344520 RepID=UPI0035F22847
MDRTDKPLLILQELFADDSFVFRTHNVKLAKIQTAQDLPQMFLAHYDSLPDDIKADLPLTPSLLKQINTPMTAAQACTALGLPMGSISPAWHIKISGTAVIACDALSLALHTQFTNTAKSSQAVYGEKHTLIEQEATRWQLAGCVNVLYKNAAYQLISVDLQGDDLELTPTVDGYVRLPNAHALATTHAINTLKNNHPDKMKYLHDAILEKVTATTL